VIQMLWDRGETNGYAQHLTAHPYPRTPQHTVLLLGAVGDHQVSEFALQVEARTMGAAGHVPYVAPDREFGGEHGFGITPIPSYPWKRSAYFLWDTGSPLSPLTNTPHVTPVPGVTPKIPRQALKTVLAPTARSRVCPAALHGPILSANYVWVRRPRVC
jgi:hypothetical protein